VTDALTIGVAILAVVSVASIGAVLAWWSSGDETGPRHVLDPSTPVRAAVVAYVALYVSGSVMLMVAGESDGAGAALAAGALAAFGVGAAAVRAVAGRETSMQPAASSGFRRFGVAALAAVGLVAIGWLVLAFGLPLLARDPQASREGFAGPIFDLFRWLVPPAAIAVFAASLVRRDGSGDRLVGIAAIVAVAGLEILLASRALPFELAIGALLVAHWAGRHPSRRSAVALAIAGLVMFVGVQFVRVGPEGGFSGAADAAAFAVRRTFDRVVLIHPRTLEIVATEIPAREPFFAGATYVRRLAPLLGREERPTLGYWLYERLFPGQPGGFAAPGVAGEAWANGGPLLLAVVMAAVGAFAAWLGRVLARLPGGPADRTYAALIVVAVARTYATSLNGFLLTVAAATLWWLVASGRLAGRVDRRTADHPSAL
jgi:hypothetical protein